MARASRSWWGMFRPYIYIAPVLLMVLLIYLVPLIDNVRFSFGRATLLRGFERWVGLQNYLQLASPEVVGAMWRTLIWLLVSVPLALIFGTILALLLDNPIPGRGILRVLLILPWIFPEAIFAVMWRMTLHPLLGLLNNLLLYLGLIDAPINFLSVGSALATVIGIRIWRSTPFVVLSVLAGLQSIPSELIEASRIDGASLWKQIWHVKLPLLRPVVWTSAVILSAWTLVIFDLIFILTGGGPSKATELLSIFVYESAFARQNLGIASAASMLLMLIVAVLGYFYIRSSNEEETR